MSCGYIFPDHTDMTHGFVIDNIEQRFKVSRGYTFPDHTDVAHDFVIGNIE